jgi:hypothetical protein
MTHRSLGAYAPKRFGAQGRRWVCLLGTTGLPVGLHSLAAPDSQAHPQVNEYKEARRMSTNEWLYFPLDFYKQWLQLFTQLGKFFHQIRPK